MTDDLAVKASGVFQTTSDITFRHQRDAMAEPLVVDNAETWTISTNVLTVPPRHPGSLVEWSKSEEALGWTPWVAWMAKALAAWWTPVLTLRASAWYRGSS
jgi:hypothetical protein